MIMLAFIDPKIHLQSIIPVIMLLHRLLTILNLNFHQLFDDLNSLTIIEIHDNKYNKFAMKYRVIKNEIFFDRPDSSEIKTTFNWPVVEVLELSNMVVVRTDPKPGSCDNQNVFGVAADGRILWQVAPQPQIYDDSPYTGITFASNGVKLSNWDGSELIVDAATGFILSKSQGK